MKALVISDIHSNYEALLAVAHAEEADTVWCLGDLVNYGPQPAEVVQWVRHHVQFSVRGNHDHAMATGVDCGCNDVFRELYECSQEMNRCLVTADQLGYLRELPLIETIRVDGALVRLAHAGPHGYLYRSDLTPDIGDAALQRALRDIAADLIFCGHTHLPMVRRLSGKIFVNPGSVGMPLDGNPLASYAVWQDGKVRISRARYDVEKVANQLLRTTLPPRSAERLAEIIRTGRVDGPSDLQVATNRKVAP
jgi:putative phosphoesterase